MERTGATLFMWLNFMALFCVCHFGNRELTMNYANTVSYYSFLYRYDNVHIKDSIWWPIWIGPQQQHGKFLPIRQISNFIFVSFTILNNALVCMPQTLSIQNPINRSEELVLWNIRWGYAPHRDVPHLKTSLSATFSSIIPSYHRV